MNPQNYTIFKGNPSELPDISIKFDPPPKWVPCNDPCFFWNRRRVPPWDVNIELSTWSSKWRENGQMVPVDGRPFFVVQ